MNKLYEEYIEDVIGDKYELYRMDIEINAFNSESLNAFTCIEKNVSIGQLPDIKLVSKEEFSVWLRDRNIDSIIND